MASVVNMKHSPELRAALDGADEHGEVVPIDRRTRWGNSFPIGRHGSREEVTQRYRTSLWVKVGKGEILSHNPEVNERLQTTLKALQSAVEYKSASNEQEQNIDVSLHHQTDQRHPAGRGTKTQALVSTGERAMSKHTVYDDDSAIAISAGWDQSLETYFATVFDGHDDGPSLWVGTQFQELTDPQALIEAVIQADHPLEPWRKIEPLVEQLIEDEKLERFIYESLTNEAETTRAKNSPIQQTKIHDYYEEHTLESVERLQKDLDAHFDMADATHVHPYYITGYRNLMWRVKFLQGDGLYESLVPAPQRDILDNLVQDYTRQSRTEEQIKGYRSNVTQLLADFVHLKERAKLHNVPVDQIADYEAWLGNAKDLSSRGEDIIHETETYGHHLERNPETWKSVTDGVVVLNAVLNEDGTFTSYHQLYLEPLLRESAISENEAKADREYRHFREQWHAQLAYAHATEKHPYEIAGTQQLIHNMLWLKDSFDLADNAKHSLSEQEARYRHDADSQQRVHTFLNDSSSILERHKQNHDITKRVPSTGLSVHDIATYAELKGRTLTVVQEGEEILKDDLRTNAHYLTRSPDDRQRILDHVHRLNSAIGREHASIKRDVMQELDEQQTINQKRSTHRGISL